MTADSLTRDDPHDRAAEDRAAAYDVAALGRAAGGCADLQRGAGRRAKLSSLANAALFASVLAAAPESAPAADVDALFGWWLTNRRRAGARSWLRERDALARERSRHSRLAARSPTSCRSSTRRRWRLCSTAASTTSGWIEVAPGTPAFLPPYAGGLAAESAGLRPVAAAATSIPLTARVTVNRFWQEVFGQGLVRTAGDFGVSGELPSHPELLDWLAVEFRESGWDVKQFYKLMVTSARVPAERCGRRRRSWRRDPDNRLLSRGPRFRMDAEMVRDYALAASGLLSAKIGGPSVKPYQPPGVWEAVAMIGSNTRDYKQDAGEALYRRSMYTFWKRSAPPASMDIFNAPSREHCTWSASGRTRRCRRW